MIIIVQYGVQLAVVNCKRLQIDLALQACAIFLAFEKYSCSHYLFPIALKIM